MVRANRQKRGMLQSPLHASDLMGMHRVIEASEKWGFVAQSLGLKWREDLLPSPEKSVL